MEELPKVLREPSFVPASNVQKKWKKSPPKRRNDKSSNRRSWLFPTVLCLSAEAFFIGKELNLNLRHKYDILDRRKE
jgi:hypothetical protein